MSGERVSNDRAPIRVLAVDDHLLIRVGIATLVGPEADMKLVGEASNGREAIAKFRECRPDVTLMDLQMPDMNGIDAMIAIRDEFPEARIIVLTTYTGDVQILRAMEAGAWAYPNNNYKAGLKYPSEEEIDHLKKAILIDPEYVAARNNLGVRSMAVEPAAAIAQWEVAITVDPRKGMLFNNLAVGYIMMHSPEAAVERQSETRCVGNRDPFGTACPRP